MNTYCMDYFTDRKQCKMYNFFVPKSTKNLQTYISKTLKYWKIKTTSLLLNQTLLNKTVLESALLIMSGVIIQNYFPMLAQIILKVGSTAKPPTVLEEPLRHDYWCLETGLHKCLQVHRFWSFNSAFCVMKSLFLSALVCNNLKLKTSHCSWTRLVNAHCTNFH